MSSREHVLPTPKALLGLRIVQLVVAVVLLGLAGYEITYIAFDGACLTLFTAIATLITVVYILVAELSAPAAYNYWAILGLDIFCIIFWIISMSIMAWEVAATSWYINDSSSGSTCYYDYTLLEDVCYKKRDLTKRYTTYYTYRNVMAAAAGLAGLEFILFAITLGVFARALSLHRKNGGHCTPAFVGNPPSGAAGAPVTNEPKGVELQNAGQQPVYYPPPSEQPV